MPTLRGGLRPSTDRDHEPSGSGSDTRSVGSGPTTLSSASAASRMRRVMTPLVDSMGQPGGSLPPIGTRPIDGLKPVRPVADAGMRIEPPPSDPVASGTSPAASAAADPPDEPPAERSSDHGLWVAPNTSFTVSAFQPNSGVLVLPTTTQPAARSRSTSGESLAAGSPSAYAAEPFVVTKPAASSRSLTASGTPASAPTSSPPAMRASIASASASADSPSTATKAPISASYRSIRSRAACTISRADMARAATCWAISATVVLRKSIAPHASHRRPAWRAAQCDDSRSSISRSRPATRLPLSRTASPSPTSPSAPGTSSTPATVIPP